MADGSAEMADDRGIESVSLIGAAGANVSIWTA